MFLGVLSALIACFLWAITYLLPQLLPMYTSMQSGLIRCCITALIAIAMLLPVLHQLKFLKKSDWLVAIKLTVIGNLINFLAMLYCSELAGASISGLTTGAIPVLVAVISNERDKKLGRPSLKLQKLFIPLGLICLGFIISNLSELGNIPEGSATGYFMGVALGILHTILWSWYPMVNAEWLQSHPKFSSLTWTLVQNSILLPLAAPLYFLFWSKALPGTPFLGSDPWLLIGILSFNALFCSIGAMSFWNYACKKLPTSLSIQLMVFETIFAIVMTHVLLQKFPAYDMIIGAVFLTIGVSISLNFFSKNIKEFEGKLQEEGGL